MPDLLTLDDPRACEIADSGAKAAGLAEAAARGLPVVPGVVVPADALAPAVAEGRNALSRSPAAARLAVAGARIDPAVLEALHAACAGFRHGAIVRSSSPLEGDPRWSGAFATYHEVGPDDLRAALLGCAASLFSRDVLARADEMGMSPTDLSVAALIQPWLPLDGGGTAAVASDGVVTVYGASGDPAMLVSGRAQGGSATVAVDGRVEGDLVAEGFAPDVVSGVAKLARRVFDRLGARVLEWGVADAEIRLLQVRNPVSTPASLFHLEEPARPPTTMERRLVRLALRFPGPIGELTVLPWAVAFDEPLDPAPTVVADPTAAYERILFDAAMLRAHVWGTDPETADASWSEAARTLLSGEADGSDPDIFGRLRRPDRAVAARLLGSIRGLGEALVGRGALAHPETIWRLTPHDLGVAVHDAGHRATISHGPDRWEPFIASVVAAGGEVSAGLPVAPGVGAGVAHLLVAGAGRPGPRAVLIAQRPLPQIAPLLWGCAGLVTIEGNEGAHLFEVARSLGVPAVTSPRLGVSGTPAPDTPVAVDGDRGTVAVLEADPVTESLTTVGARA